MIPYPLTIAFIVLAFIFGKAIGVFQQRKHEREIDAIRRGLREAHLDDLR